MRPPIFRIHQDGEFFFAENETLRLVGTGATPDEATADFASHLAYFHQHYAQISTSKLTGDAKRLKRLFHDATAQ